MDVFNNDGNNTPANITVDALVGDTQKYKTPDELAKAYVNAEAFIDRLKQEKAEEARKAAEAAAKLEVYERLAAAKNNDPTPNRQDPPNPEPKVAQPQAEDLEDKIRSTLEAERVKERKTANRNIVNNKMTELYGDKAREVLTAKAQELGVGMDWLVSIAETSPAAFFNTLGIVEKAPTGTPGIKNDINTASLPNTQKVAPNSYQYFAEMRKTDPRRYYSAEVQRQVFEAAKSNPNFYN
jgi:hypothetical protein